MLKYKRGYNVQNFDALTEALRRGRRRIRRGYVPELAAYLLMISYRYERMAQSSRQVCKDSHDIKLKETIKYIHSVLSTIQILIDGLMDGWDKIDWERATDEVASNMGISPDQPLPSLENAPYTITVPNIGD